MKQTLKGLCGEEMTASFNKILRYGSIKCSEAEFKGFIRLPEIICIQICSGCEKAPKGWKKPKGLKARGIFDMR